MTSKHTPGPWHVDLMHRGDIQTLDGRDVCSVWSAEDVGTVHTIGSGGGRFVPDEDCDANAHLIAAAPEMYEALEAADFMFAALCVDRESETRRKLRAALSKARGEA